MLLIIDNQSSFIKKFKRNFLAEQDFEYVFFDHNQPLSIPSQTKITGLMLSGGRGNPYEPLNLTTNFIAMMNFDVPTIGFCLGHEIIGVAYMARLKKLPTYNIKREKVTITNPDDPIFEGVTGTEFFPTRRHNFHISDLPDDFIGLAESDLTPNEIIRHKDKPIYGFQAHPEVSGGDGMTMVKNFLKMCGYEIK